LARNRNTQDENRRLPRLSGPGLIFRYGAFAVAAMIANLAAQRLVFAFAANEIRLALALVAGTGVGLVLKYVLDRKWIFFAPLRPAVQEARRFSLYTLTGVATTLLFWATESSFWLFWHDQTAREGGAILGLTAGYVIKYHLDRRFVFRA
jgi:putative flippase GtrA